MNLNRISIAPFVQGVIRVDVDGEADTLKTSPNMVICARTHLPVEAGAPKLGPHPIQAKVLESVVANKEAGKVVEVPITMFFNKAENGIGIQYKAYDREKGTPLCAGDGKTAHRLATSPDQTQTLIEVACPGAETCAFANSEAAACRRQVKMVVQIVGQDDPLSVFEVRSGSLNNYRTLAAQLKIVERRYGGLRHVPLKLTMWQASNQASNYEAFDLMRLSIGAPTEAQAMEQAKKAREQVAADGLVDDMDDLFITGDERPTFAELMADDFQMVRDFYEESPVRPNAVKHSGRSPVRAAAIMDGGVSMASSMIADALRNANNASAAQHAANVPPVASQVAVPVASEEPVLDAIGEGTFL